MLEDQGRRSGRGSEVSVARNDTKGGLHAHKVSEIATA